MSSIATPPSQIARRTSDQWTTVEIVIPGFMSCEIGGVGDDLDETCQTPCSVGG